MSASADCCRLTGREVRSQRESLRRLFPFTSASGDAARLLQACGHALETARGRAEGAAFTHAPRHQAKAAHRLRRARMLLEKVAQRSEWSVAACLGAFLMGRTDELLAAIVERIAVEPTPVAWDWQEERCPETCGVNTGAADERFVAPEAA